MDVDGLTSATKITDNPSDAPQYRTSPVVCREGQQTITMMSFVLGYICFLNIYLINV